MPVFFDTRLLALGTPSARFHENDRPGPSFIQPPESTQPSSLTTIRWINLRPNADLGDVGSALGFCAGGELRRGINPLKFDNYVTRAMLDVMKLISIASNRHLRNLEAPDAFVQEIIPVATPKIPVNVQRFSIRIYRYRSNGLEPSFSGSTSAARTPTRAKLSLRSQISQPAV